MKRLILGVLAILGAVCIMLALTLWILRVSPSSSLLAYPKPGSTDGAERPSSVQPAEPGQLPEHPSEDMGVAGLSPSTGMPHNAISEVQAIAIVTETTWGPYRDELLKSHPASAIPAVYNAQESSMGPAADQRPVRVVILDGWAPAGRCGPRDPGPPGPEGSSSQSPSPLNPGGESAPGTVSAGYSIVDAVTGQMLGGWNYTRCG